MKKYSLPQQNQTSQMSLEIKKMTEDPLEKQTMKLKKLQEKLFFLWDKFNIPFHHREIFVENFKTIKNEELIKIVEQEIFKMDKNCSLIQVFFFKKINFF